MIFRFSAGLLVWLTLALSFAVSAAEPARLLKDFPVTRLIVINDSGPCILIDTWVATTPEQRARGLMYIEQLDQHEGMIFLYAEPQIIAMWMKNTLIPLDMLFIRGDRRIARIEENTEPHSTDSIFSGEAVVMVLELAGGSAKRWSINAEDYIVFADSAE